MKKLVYGFLVTMGLCVGLITPAFADEVLLDDSDFALVEELGQDDEDEPEPDEPSVGKKSGKAGNDAVYELEDGVLTLSGLGEIGMAFQRALTDEDKASIKKVVVKPGITTIDYLENCANLETVELPLSMRYIREYAFRNCVNLNKVMVPKNVETIEYGAFEGCKKLTTLGGYGSECNVEMGKSFRHIASAFPYIEEYHADAEWGSIASEAIIGSKSLKKVVIDEGVSVIGGSAFSECTTLEEVVMPSTITSINDMAFYKCSNLAKMTIPGGCVSIENEAFYGCVTLEEVEIEEGVKKIGSNAFKSCVSLYKIIIPESVEQINVHAFDFCDLLTITTKYESVAYKFAVDNKIPVICTDIYTVKFNKNGGSGHMASQIMSEGKRKQIMVCTLKRKGYVFDSWNTKANGKGISYRNGAVVKDIAKVGKTITLYAQWKPIKYKIKFNKNGATSGSMSSQTFTYDKSAKLQKNKFKRSGYVFIGWSLKKNGSGKIYKNAATVKNLAYKNGATVTLYAIWKKK